MNEQLSIFDSTQNGYEDKIRKMLCDVIQERELPENSLQLNEQNNANKDEYIIQIWEPEYPFNKAYPKGTYTPILMLKPEKTKVRKGYIQIIFMKNVFGEIPELPDNLLDPELSDSDGYRKYCFMPEDIDDIIPFIKYLVEEKLNNYSSGAKTFGCCSRTEECIKQGKCVHSNKLYGTSCMLYWKLKNKEFLKEYRNEKN